jgi:hypothetical protein
MQRQAPPAAADVEQPHTGAQPELAADEVQLGLLGGVEAVPDVVPDSAGVDHRRAEDEGVEVVADVVVRGHGGGVTGAGVPPAPTEVDLLHRRWRLGAERTEPGGEAEEPQSLPCGERWHAVRVGKASRRGQRGERGEEVAVDVELTRHIRPAEAELARLPGQPAQRAAGAHDDHGGAGGTGLGAVPRAQPDRQFCAAEHETQRATHSSRRPWWPRAAHRASAGVSPAVLRRSTGAMSSL